MRLEAGDQPCASSQRGVPFIASAHGYRGRRCGSDAALDVADISAQHRAVAVAHGPVQQQRLMDATVAKAAIATGQRDTALREDLMRLLHAGGDRTSTLLIDQAQ